MINHMQFISRLLLSYGQDIDAINVFSCLLECGSEYIYCIDFVLNTISTAHLWDIITDDHSNYDKAKISGILRILDKVRNDGQMLWTILNITSDQNGQSNIWKRLFAKDTQKMTFLWDLVMDNDVLSNEMKLKLLFNDEYSFINKSKSNEDESLPVFISFCNFVRISKIFSTEIIVDHILNNEE